MLVFGHLGFGQTLARPFSRNLPIWPIFLGALLPDLIDKPLYYGLCWYTGKHGADLGLISGTRTLGHTGLFLCCLIIAALLLQSRVFAALAIGDATHLLLDGLPDWVAGHSLLVSTESALFWPLTGTAFPVSPYDNLMEHFLARMVLYIIATEVIGVALLVWDFRRKK